MIIIILITILLTGWVIFSKKCERESYLRYRKETESEILDLIGTTHFVAVALLVIWIVILVCFPIFYIANMEAYQEIISLQDTLPELRENASEMERVALAHEIVDLNKTIARMKWYKTTFMGFVIPDGVQNLEYLY